MRKTDLSQPRAVIFSCAGPFLSAAEKAFFEAENPFDFILFARNVENPDQVRKLIDDLRECVGREDAPVLVDQEGGRVQRLRSPHWFTAPSFGKIGALYATDKDKACRAAMITTELIAHDLIECGFNVNCSPSLDMNRPETSNVIGDRSFGLDQHMITELALIVAKTYLDCGVMPVIKHMPGHGRAIVDSHHELPVVDTTLEDLEATDFVPFKALNSQPWGMTAHIVFEAVDKNAPATQSPAVIKNIIRGSIGFDGLLLSDDLNMNALAGDLDLRAARALEAGVDIILHCSGDLDEMRKVAPHCPPLPATTVRRIEAAAAQLGHGKTIDMAALKAELQTLIPLE